MRLTSVLAVLVGLVAAQTLPHDAPSCALNCLGSSGCAATDEECLCGSNDTQNALFSCARQACDDDDDFSDLKDAVRRTCSALTRAASSSSTASASPPSTSSHASNNDKSGSSSRIGAALGGTLGGVAFVAIAALLFLYLRRRHSESDRRPRQRKRRSSPDPEEEFDDPPVHERDYDPFRASQLQPLHNEDDEWSPTAPTGLHTARHFPAVVGQKSPSAMDDLTHAQKDMVHMMFERGAASAAVEEVVARMRAENRGEADAPPQYDFEDSKGQRIMAASP